MDHLSGTYGRLSEIDRHLSFSLMIKLLTVGSCRSGFKIDSFLFYAKKRIQPPLCCIYSLRREYEHNPIDLGNDSLRSYG